MSTDEVVGTGLLSQASDGRGEESDIRQRILGAACGLFAKKGYAATSIREITKAAQVTNPMIYYYFGSKEELFMAVLIDAMAKMGEKIAAVLADTQGMRARLVAVMMANFEALRESPDLARLFVATQFGVEQERFGVRLRELIRGDKEYMRHLLLEGQREGVVDPAIDMELAFIHLSGVIHVPMLHFLSGDLDSWDEARAQALVDQFLCGVGHQKGGEES